MNIYGGDNFLNDINLFGGYSSMMDEIDINESCFGILIYQNFSNEIREKM